MNTFGRHTYHDATMVLRSWLPDESIIVGSFCSIAPNVTILAGGRHRTDFASTYPFERVMLDRTASDRAYQTTRNTIIGNDVWICTSAMILGGSHVGHGAVIGAGAVVHGKVPPYAIVVGNPASVLCYRFSPETVQRLLKIAWWNWTDEFIAENLDWFYEPINKFLEHFEVLR